jgi:type VI secretion system secreted protein VgrG
VKAAAHDWSGGGSTPASFLALPSGSVSIYSAKKRLVDQDSGEPLAQMPYFIRLKGGVVSHGVTDTDGYTELANADAAESGKVYVGHDAMKMISKFGA